MTTGDYSPPSQDSPPLELEAVTTEPARTETPSEVEGLTLTEATSRYEVSLSTLRRAIREGRVAGAVLVPGPKGQEYRVPGEALEVLGYRARPGVSTERVRAGRAEAEGETLTSRVKELEAALEVERLRRETAEAKAELLTANLDDLRTALAKLPAALPPAEKPRKWWRKNRASIPGNVTPNS